LSRIACTARNCILFKVFLSSVVTASKYVIDGEYMFQWNITELTQSFELEESHNSVLLIE
jgi:hypothetical protein